MSAIHRRLVDLEMGNYAVSATEEGITSEITAEINNLSRKLALTEQSSLEQAVAVRADVLHSAEELKKLLSTLRGNAEVLRETGIIADKGYEGKLLDEIIQLSVLAEDESERLRTVRF
jgi:hypothetical protein